MNKILKGILFFLFGAAAFSIISIIRKADYGLAEYEQFPLLFAFYFICGWLLNLSQKVFWPYPLLFILPAVGALGSTFILNHRGLFHFIGETLMIIPGYLIGFYISKWPKKGRTMAAIFIPALYFFYISKINPELAYYNNSVRLKSIQTVPDNLLPNFQFKKKDGSTLFLDDFKGKVILIDFYFNRCSQCIKKMPDLVKINTHYSNNPDFVLLSVHRGGSESFSDFLSLLKKLPEGLNYVYDTATAAAKYFTIHGYPVEILIDKSGRVRDQFSGYNADLALVYEKKTIKKIDALLNEKH